MSLIPWNLILKGLAAIALIAALWWAWDHYVADPYIAEGVAQEKVHTDEQAARAERAEAANTTLAADVTTMKAHVQDQDAGIAVLQDAERKALTAKLDALAKLDKEKAAHRATQEQLQVAASTPAADPQAACVEAAKILEALGLAQHQEDQ